MTDNDNEIVIGLRCLSGEAMICWGCAYNCDPESCKKNVSIDAIDLINRQKEKIEGLEDVIHDTSVLLAKHREIEKKEHEKMNEGLRQIGEMIPLAIANVRAEAIKEFARRVKATFPPREDPHCTDDDIFTLNSIDQIMEDMLSEPTKGE